MKLFYRTTIALSIFLVVAFLTVGPAAALEPIGNVTELPIADCSYTVSGNTITITDLSTNADNICCDYGDGFPVYKEPGETFSYTYTTEGEKVIEYIALKGSLNNIMSVSLEFSKDGEYVDDEIIGVDSKETGAEPETIENP